MKWLYKAMEDLVWVSQLGLSLMMPLLLLLGLCYWLTTSFDFPMWIYLPGFVFGIGGGMSSFWNFWKLFKSRNRKIDKETRRAVFFNKHH